LLDSMVFEKRRQVYKEVNTSIQNTTGMDVKSLESTVPEYLFYSNLGRSDLIYFKVWLSNFRKENGTENYLADAISSS
jgi:hypothetical protein